jgi:serine/threonine protein kinase
MPADSRRIKELFAAVLELPDPQARQAFLKRECAGDPELHQRLAALLRAHDQPQPALDQPLPAIAPGPEAHVIAPEEQPGTILAGKYKLLERIGEGGMGSVWMAQQQEPVKRTVAIKLIKHGADSRGILARFEAERQALALMDHPNIAKVLDAGTTDAEPRTLASGPQQQPLTNVRGSEIPFFVMELVKGVPITRFCDTHKLTPRQRLELFVPVCQAIQHAHQKGVIHRDVKPSNVLVALYNDRPVPKVIDFGLAKATGPQLTEQTLVTGFGALVGTPQYMSPEQATLNNLDIDTRSDIYSLGVLLYELLAGSPPFSRKELEQAGMLEVLRVIREEEPLRPSIKLSSDHALPSLAANRGTEPAKLTRLMRGELDWIVMKALEKERSRRYETANGLAMDIQRYLADEPVQAARPSASYRLKKLMRRYRKPLLAAALIFLALVAGVVGTTLGLIQANEQANRALIAQAREGERAEAETKERERAVKAEAEAKEEKKRADKNAAEAKAEAQRAKDKLELANAVTDFLRNDVLAQAGSIAQADRGFEPDPNLTVKDALDRAAAAVADKFKDRPELEANIRETLGEAFHDVAQYDKATVEYRLAADIRRRCLGADHPDTLEALHNLAVTYEMTGRFKDAIDLLEKVRDGQTIKLGPEHPDTLMTLVCLAWGYNAAGRTSEAIKLYQHVRDLAVNKLGADHPTTLKALGRLADAYHNAGKTEDAITLSERVRDVTLKRFGPHHPESLGAMQFIASLYGEIGKTSDATALLKQVYDAAVTTCGPEHPLALSALSSLAAMHLKAGKRAEGLALYQQLYDVYKKKFGADYPGTLRALVGLGVAHEHARNTTTALVLLEQARNGYAKIFGEDHPHTLTTINHLAWVSWRAKQFDKAIPLYEQIVNAGRKSLGEKHPETLRRLANLGANYLDAKRPRDAVPCLEQAYIHGHQFGNLQFAADSLFRAYLAAGRKKEALALLSARRAAARFGHAHEETLAALHNLAATYIEVGRSSQGIALAGSVRDDAVKRFGPDDSRTVAATHNLAAGYRAIDKHELAMSLLEEVLKRQKAKFGLEDAKTLTIMRSLGVVYRDAGEFDKALPVLEQAFELQKAKLGPDHAETLVSMNELGVLYWKMKRLERSIPIFEESLRVHKRKLGDTDPNTLQAMANLGINYRDAGRLKEAVAVLEEAYLKGRQHVSPSWVSKELLPTYLRAGKKTEAAVLLKENLASVRRRLKPDSPELADELVGTALQLLLLNAFADAETILRDAEAIRQKGIRSSSDVGHIAPEMQKLVDIQAMIGRCLLRQEKWADAEALLRDCLAFRVNKQPDSWGTFNTRSMLGEALLAQKKYEEAVPLLKDGYAGLKLRLDKIPQPLRTLRLTEAVQRLVQLYEATGNEQETAHWREELEGVKARDK